MAGWSSLPSDLVGLDGDRFLGTNDLDYYVAFRGVCRNWRSATADPSADSTDPHFHPTKWVMLEHSMDGAVTFMNVRTGRFLCKFVPWLRSYSFVAEAEGGFLVLAEEPYQTGVLNPFTGVIAHFKAPMVARRERYYKKDVTLDIYITDG